MDHEIGRRFAEAMAKKDGTFLVEQQAYVGTTADRIDWLRILCSGFRPAG